MDFSFIIDLFLHLDKYLNYVISAFGVWSYVLLFLVIFMETGLVVTPFLPGDSLLFAAGALAATGSFDVVTLWVTLSVAAFLGDTVNYWIGHFIGPKAFKDDSRLFKKQYLDKAQAFYNKHGGKAIILARYVPIVRTFAPFVAGIGKMNYRKFLMYNLVGGLAWVTIFVWGGYLFGNIPFIKENFEYMTIGIVIMSLIPIVFEFIQERRSHNKEAEPVV